MIVSFEDSFARSRDHFSKHCDTSLARATQSHSRFLDKDKRIVRNSTPSFTRLSKAVYRTIEKYHSRIMRPICHDLCGMESHVPKSLVNIKRPREDWGIKLAYLLV
jgi:hypothetical protein